MKIVEFWGSSDDLIEVDGEVIGCDEYNLTDMSKPAVFQIKTKREMMKVTVVYDNGGTWCFGVGRLDEFPLPDWQFNIITDDESKNDYTVVLQVQVPDDAEIVRKQ